MVGAAHGYSRLDEVADTAYRAGRSRYGAANRVLLSDLKIRTKDQRLIVLAPNEIQEQCLEALEWGSVDFKQKRELWLKGRQFGLSTLILALLFCDTVNTPNTTTVVVAHDAESTERLFRMVKLFYANLPEEKKPPYEYASRREFYWPGINSSFFVGQAGSRSFGRSTTINNLHCSEIPNWPDADTLFTGLMQAVTPEGNVFIESTAEGLGNTYHQLWQAATEVPPQSSFVPRFFSWRDHSEYRSKVPAGFEKTPEETALARRHDLDDEQIYWRRLKLMEPGMDPQKFKQEYPLTADEAFITTGNPYFDRDKLKSLEDRAKPPLKVRMPLGGLARNKDSIEVYVVPTLGRSYIITADVAEGLSDDGKHDFDSADVFDRESWEQVCHMHGSWEPHEFGMLLAELGHLYGKALIAPERNNHGHATIAALIHSAFYENVYKHEDYDEHKRTSVKKPGWPTTAKSKYVALDDLSQAVDENDIGINSKKSLAEMMTFVKKPGGKAGGEGNSHDDRVTSLAIGAALLKSLPRRGGVTVLGGVGG